MRYPFYLRCMCCVCVLIKKIIQAIFETWVVTSCIYMYMFILTLQTEQPATIVGTEQTTTSDEQQSREGSVTLSQSKYIYR